MGLAPATLPAKADQSDRAKNVACPIESYNHTKILKAICDVMDKEFLLSLVIGAF